MDETPLQLIGEICIPIAVRSVHPARHDCEYPRNGTCNVVMATELLIGSQISKVTEWWAKVNWAEFLKKNRTAVQVDGPKRSGMSV